MRIAYCVPVLKKDSSSVVLQIYNCLLLPSSSSIFQYFDEVAGQLCSTRAESFEDFACGSTCGG